jgi:hypothetical protein
MLNDRQVRTLRQLLERGETLAAAARKANMDDKSARKYRQAGKLPSQMRAQRTWRTRQDPFAEVWPEIQMLLEREPGLQAITLLQEMQRRYPGRFFDSHRRTLERRVADWRAKQGPAKDVVLTQQHHPGQLAASDFTCMNSLGVTIARMRLDHMVFHCVLTYSNWESVTLCYTESFESLSYGLQEAFWQMGGVPDRHRTDSLSAAVNNLSATHELRGRYQELMDHYRVVPHRINVRQPQENGDVESSHGHFKTAIDQALLLRGSRDFETVDAYRKFLLQVVERRNSHRQDKFLLEQQHLHELPLEKIDHRTFCAGIRVSRSSVIRVKKNTYSVPSRLIGREVDCLIEMDEIIVRYAGQEVQRMPRLIGSEKSLINYRHVIDTLVRKPGAFENYKYREEMFPNSYFRMAYDRLRQEHSDKIATRDYLQLLQLAARESQDLVTDALRTKLNEKTPLSVGAIREAVESRQQLPAATDVNIDAPDLSVYDFLLQHLEMEVQHHDDSPDHEAAKTVDGGFAGDHDEIEICRIPVTAIDQHVSRSETSRVSGTLCEPGSAGDSGISQSHSVSDGTDGTGGAGAQTKSDQPFDAGVTSATLENLGEFSVAATSICCGPADGISAGWIVSGSSGEPADFWQSRFGEESLSRGTWRTTDSAGSLDPVYHLQSAGAAIAAGQTGTATAERDPEAAELRRPDHRRSGICAADSRRNGSHVHAAGRTLRTRQRAADQQSSILQMGTDLQGLHDHGSGHRSTGPSQRNPGTQRPQLPTGEGPKTKTGFSIRTTPGQFQSLINRDF